MTIENNKELSAEQCKELISAMKVRFEENMNRHKGLEWSKIQAKLEVDNEKLWSLNEMERSGGEPDVIGYDREALESRTAHKPKNSVIDMAAAMGIELITEDQYREMQRLGGFDLKTSSWVKTPADIRKLGGALFCDRRYDTVFVYHNGADSYYAARGFRGALRIK